MPHVSPHTRLFAVALMLALPACQSSAPPVAPPPVADVAPAAFDFRALLGDPPADDSPAHRAEADDLLARQAARTPADVARVTADGRATAFTAFAPVLGPWFDARSLPVTAAVLTSARDQAKADVDAAKAIWHRPRPAAVDGRVHPCVPPEPSPSFPSGQAAWGVTWAVLLGDVFPERRAALIARSRQLGTDRSLAGLHWPTDVAAGQTLGCEVARRLIADPEFRAALDRAAAECRAAAGDQLNFPVR